MIPDTVKDGEIVDLSKTPITNVPIRGGVKIYKRDKLTGAHSALGKASLKDAELTISNESVHPVLCDINNDGDVTDEGEQFAPHEDIITIKTDEKGYAETSPTLLPFGHYKIRETKPPKGYLWAGTLEREFDIDETTQGELKDLTREEDSVENIPIRGNFSLRKILEGTQDTLGYVTFSITSNTTGERHEFTTDKMGRYSSARYKHSSNTNGGGTKDGLWFGKYKADDGTIKTAPVDDTLGALPYDTYTIQELYIKDVDGNDITGKNSLTLTLYVDDETLILNEDGSKLEEDMIDMNNVENIDIRIGTTATDKATGSHTIAPSGKATIVDTVSYKNLIPGKDSYPDKAEAEEL